MEVICKEKQNVIFWRHEHGNDWSWADLDEVISTYEDEPYTILNLWETVRREGTDEFLYNVWECSTCEELVLTVDEEHGYSYCPHCGRMIVDAYF